MTPERQLQRHASGQCARCQSPTTVNPRTGHYYWLCRPHRVQRVAEMTAQRRAQREAGRR